MTRDEVNKQIDEICKSFVKEANILYSDGTDPKEIVMFVDEINKITKSTIPNSVVGCSETCGGYLGVEHTFFTITGEPVERMEPNGWLVTGNYYGSAIFKITDSDLERYYID